jgi:hypothetical protein
MSKGSTSMQALDQEIRQLKARSRQLEEKLDENFSYLQEHGGSLLIRTLLPRRTDGEESLTGIRLLDVLLENERVQKILLRAADQLADSVGDGLNWLITKVFKK